MLLAIDVGNTNIVLGVFDGATLVQSWRLQTLRERTSDELGLLVDGLFAHSRIERVRIRGVILGSVVPPLTGTMRAMVQRYFGVAAMVVEPGVNTSMPILYENPSEVGADRIVNAIAAYEKFGNGLNRPLIVVDFGTATTLDAITAKGEYLGGAICPGVTISADALFQRAARLPRIEVRKPARVVGRTTVGAMESAVLGLRRYGGRARAAHERRAGRQRDLRRDGRPRRRDCAGDAAHPARRCRPDAPR